MVKVVSKTSITFGNLSGKYDLERSICTWEWSNRWEGVGEGERKAFEHSQGSR